MQIKLCKMLIMQYQNLKPALLHWTNENEISNYCISKVCHMTVVNRSRLTKAKQKAQSPCDTKNESFPPFIHCCMKNKFIYVLHDLAVECISNLCCLSSLTTRLWIKNEYQPWMNISGTFFFCRLVINTFFSLL